MLRSTCWSFLSIAMAVASFMMHRDISANIFICALFIIQALKPVEEERLNQSAMTFCAMFGTAVVGFAVCAWAFGLKWLPPASW